MSRQRPARAPARACFGVPIPKRCRISRLRWCALAATRCRLVSFSQPRKVARLSPPWSSTWQKPRSRCSPRWRSSALPLALWVARLARRKAAPCSSLSFCGFLRPACGSEMTVRTAHSWSCAICSRAKQPSSPQSSRPSFSKGASGATSLSVATASITRSQTRVGFHHAAVNPQLASARQPVLAQRLEEHPVNGLEWLEAQPFANHAQAGMIRGLLGEVAARIPANRQAVGAATRDGPLAGQVLEESHREHLQIHHRIDAGPPAFARVRVGRLADGPDLPGETDVFQGPVDPPVKPIRDGRRQFPRHDPKFLLFLAWLASCKHVLHSILCRAYSWRVFQQAVRQDSEPIDQWHGGSLCL